MNSMGSGYAKLCEYSHSPEIFAVENKVSSQQH